ncbi:hypothetical protein L6164_022650 [Bauhinia variegata]|uniref:Uncharacterized protein n=1 Tax=Bauhinia variegata TaxID=167791 RepID=A0ACB9MH49_BAUVA|nr:hypothetical protein L6164_022650 [Bauhinia variegata]
MAKSFAFFALLVSVVCFSSLLDLAQANKEKFHVEGKIYCDPCRLEFENRLSTPLPGATVVLECKYENNETVTFKSKEVVTDQNGHYNIEAEGDHPEEENCKVTALKSSHPECNDPMSGMESDRIVLTKNMGVRSKSRFVNSLGFMPKQVTNDQCKIVVAELAENDKKDD